MANITRHILDNALERVARTGKHLEDLKGCLAAVIDEYKNAHVLKFEPESPYRPMLIVPDTLNVPVTGAILIGEICYNLRAGLDYLIFELANLDSGGEKSGQLYR